MLKTVTVINYRGEQNVIELRNPEKSGFLITDIQGLGPGKTTINMTEINSYDGAVYNSSRRSTRNIVITMQFMWARTIEEARYASYRLFPTRKPVKLIFKTDSRYAAIDGYVESNEPSIFQKTSTTQISILCGDPYFYSYETNGTQVAEFATVEPLFEFPMDIPLNVGVELSSVASSSAVIEYDGDVTNGFDLYLEAHGEIQNLRITDESTGESMLFQDSGIQAITDGSSIESGDKIYICTRKGHKQATLIKGIQTYNILNALGRNPTWLSLNSGFNEFSYSSDGGVVDANVRIEYQVLYEGV